MMVDAKNGAFQLQVRTGLAQGNSTTATIFTAGVAKEENASTVEVKVRRGGKRSKTKPVHQFQFKNCNLHTSEI